MTTEEEKSEKDKKIALENAYKTFTSFNYKQTTIEEVDKLLVEFSLNIDALDEVDETPLIKCLLAGNFELAKYFLDKGANMYAYDTGGRTSMMICAQKGYLDFAKELIKKGYDINKKVPSNNHSVLSLAVWANQVEMVRLLLQNGADPNIKDNLGWSSFDVAEFCNNPEIIKELEGTNE